MTVVQIEPKMTRLHQAFWNNTAEKPESVEAQHLKIKGLEALWSKNE